jgi:dihydrofolate reductase
MLSIIAAIGENNAIGKDNRLLWHITEDLKHFKTITLGHPVIMGRRTFESMGKALSGRTNIIISRNPQFAVAGSIVVPSLEQAIDTASEIDDHQFVIGGATVYSQAIHIVETMYLTIVHNEYDADAFFPDFSQNEWSEIEKKEFTKGTNFNYPFSFLKLKRI